LYNNSSYNQFTSIISSDKGAISYSKTSAILGGYYNSIISSTNSVILGGKNLTLSGENDLVYVPELKISTASNNDTEDRLLVWDSVDDKVKWRDANTISGGGGGSSSTGSLGVTVDGVTGVIQVGQVGYIDIPYDGTITDWSIISNVSGSIQFDVWNASGVIPTVANTIIGAGTKPSLSNQQIIFGTPSGWTTVSFLAGDILGFYVDSASTVKRATLTLKINKS
jgi:hypothetical protein